MADITPEMTAAVDEETIWITVLVTAFNAERWLGEAIESVLAQTYPWFELILIDDGSSDSTPSITEDYAQRDPRVRAVMQGHWGRVASLNHGLELAAHDWVALLDADDVMLPNRLERQVRFLRDNPDVVVASSFSLYIDTQGREVGRFSTDLTDRATVDRYLRRKLAVGYFHQSAAMMRRNIVRALGGYRSEFAPNEDVDLWNRVAHAGHLVLVQPEYLVKYRIHGNSLSVTQVRAQSFRFRWIAECVRCRLSGLPEPSRTEFEEFERRQPWIQRLNRERQIAGRTMFMRARSSYSERRRLIAALELALAITLSPSMSIGKVWSRKIHR